MQDASICHGSIFLAPRGAQTVSGRSWKDPEEENWSRR
jgi:hypothetical protein